LGKIEQTIHSWTLTIRHSSKNDLSETLTVAAKPRGNENVELL